MFVKKNEVDPQLIKTSPTNPTTKNSGQENIKHASLRNRLFGLEGENKLYFDQVQVTSFCTTFRDDGNCIGRSDYFPPPARRGVQKQSFHCKNSQKGHKILRLIAQDVSPDARTGSNCAQLQINPRAETTSMENVEILTSPPPLKKENFETLSIKVGTR